MSDLKKSKEASNNNLKKTCKNSTHGSGNNCSSTHEKVHGNNVTSNLDVGTTKNVEEDKKVRQATCNKRWPRGELNISRSHQLEGSSSGSRLLLDHHGHSKSARDRRPLSMSTWPKRRSLRSSAVVTPQSQSHPPFSPKLITNYQLLPEK
ncbi:hypothetical protein KP509_23G058300 [Ceratopteris richardii]|nr:hypothetical protein KP509_23G058300 [Ceratopteris richardii]KAH7302141.1 hypothetical protein KP509_23G058300 [Ceratopteris richardii]KAH7302142.1 hypothetical protein KP509_23G058300 [Ceratopteris richardii]